VPDVPRLAPSIVERAGAPDRLLVLLHGYGEPAAQLTDRLDLLDPDGRFLVAAPLAPFERRGRAIWHRAMTARDEAEAQFRASLSAVDALLGDLERETGLPAREAIVGGFSQGGGLGLALLLGADVEHRPAAAFGVCSFPPTVQGFRVDRAAATGRPFWLSSAHGDHFAPIESSRAGAALLREVGLALTYVESDGGHEMTDEAARGIGRWLRELRDAGDGPAPTDAELVAHLSGEHPFYEDLWEQVAPAPGS
jgi:predicted esterase